MIAGLLLALSMAVQSADPANDWIVRAAAAWKEGEIDKAFEFVDKSIAIDPTNKAGYLFRAALREANLGSDRVGSLKSALADYTAVLKIDPKDVDALQSRGCVNFKLAKFGASVADFDTFLAERPEARKQHWQRGISLYYAGKYDEGAKQFESYQDHDSNDVENAVWRFLCMAKSVGVPKARADILKIGDDRRVPMRQVYDLFAGTKTPDDVLAAASKAGDEKTRRGQLFYAHLYLGLWFDATGEPARARQHMDAAANDHVISHYMGDVARVHRDLLRDQQGAKGEEVTLLFADAPVAPVESELMFEIVGLIAFPLLVAVNGFFVAAEFALVAVRKTRMEDLHKKGIRGAGAVLAALARLDRCIAASQLGITLASLGLGFVVERGLASVLSALFGFLPAPFEWMALHSVSATFAFFVITFLHVVLGELFPKTVALQAPDRVALWLTPPLLLFEMAMRPFISAMSFAANILFRAFKLQPVPEGMVHSVEELTLLIDDTEEAGLIDSDQATLLKNVFLFTNKKVSDCMVPREKMDALSLTTPLPAVLERVRSSGHTRMPVYEGSIDNIVGIVNTKDLFFLIGVDNVVVLEDALYPAIFLKPDEEAANALRLFKRSKKHLALVRDEQDKILGVVTLEDILEEIIGELEDEQDLPIPPRSLRKLRRYRPRRRK